MQRQRRIHFGGSSAQRSRGQRIAAARTYSHANADGKANLDAHGNADAHVEADGHPDTQGHGNPDPNTHADSNPDPDTHADSNSDPDAHADRNADPDPETDRNADPHPKPDACRNQDRRLYGRADSLLRRAYPQHRSIRVTVRLQQHQSVCGSNRERSVERPDAERRSRVAAASADDLQQRLKHQCT